jgi:phosphopantetheinyl transferase
MVAELRFLNKSSPFVVPPVGGIRVWQFQATQEAEERARLMLTAEEVEDIDRLAMEQDRRTAAVSRAAWREAAASFLGIEPMDVVVARTPYGRPFAEGLERTVVDLSTSHSGDMVALAVGNGILVGVDVQATGGLQIDEHIGRAVETVIGPAIDLVPDATERTLLAWCILEALLKADGRGMHLSLSLVSSEVRSLWGWNSSRVGGTAWWVRRLSTPAGFVGAVAAAGPVIDIDFFDPI